MYCLFFKKYLKISNVIVCILFLMNCKHVNGLIHSDVNCDEKKPSLSNNKIVYLIAPPRTLSTAFLRMMQARGDFDVMNEPLYHFLDKEQRVNLKNIILKKAETSNVFVKEVSHNHILSFFDENKDLILKDNVYFLFLMRNPHHAVISYYKKACIEHKQRFSKIREKFSKLVGYENLYKFFLKVKEKNINSAFLVLSEDLCAKPEGTYRSICNFLNINYIAAALQWDILGEKFNGKEWNASISSESMTLWHGDVLNSSGFYTPTSYAVSELGEPTFEEVAQQDRNICMAAYIENLVFYKLLKDIAMHIQE